MGKTFPYICHIWTDRHNAPDSPRARVLVVDDHINAAEGVAAWLDSETLECRVAFGGAEAIRTASEWKPNVILMDISMPGCNGYQAARALRNDCRTQKIAIVAYTALDESEVRRHLTDHEFDAFCQKGQGASGLPALIHRFIS